ncbi:anthranilate phosphoribosyltransferase [Candidatus Saganbacteria bacterium]|nr:anthranilate phosphoribosyltransferase [Candidatus Saganbacteria bacterium]
MIKEAIKKVIDGKNLTEEEASLTARTIMSGEATPSQIGSLLTALHIKGETVSEITGFAREMQAYAQKIEPNVSNLVDTCGTGGDSSQTFNISTISALVVAGAGVPVAKHGNRSISSKCGSADLLEALGAKVDLQPEKVKECIEKIGFGFMFAPIFHPAMKYAGPTRKEIGFRTIFNVLGPLTNPAQTKKQIIGVYSEKLVDVIAEVLKNLGIEHAMVVHGMDGLDEISLSDKTKVAELINGKIKKYFVSPKDFYLKKAEKNIFKVQNVEGSKIVALSILERRETGPLRDIVVLNAAAAIYLAGCAKDIKEGFKYANESIDSGAAFNKLNEVIKFTQGA